ncbi:hypothetical protein [Chroococcidiopsis sp. CCNUC1]|uniref:hypothetical protein n=1 Tax=Chroococcidiopsis sp. CCNUC1 TaxID=2653189 RepID=UPI00201FD80D|nr:hypothetical protein [Chroococcidiopsis sp. CCNUC1]URD48739.1 hypothetical protein M5J74_20685 [Chroococcidiopsis sp. CCNUC1]
MAKPLRNHQGGVKLEFNFPRCISVISYQLSVVSELLPLVYCLLPLKLGDRIQFSSLCYNIHHMSDS